MSRDRWGSRNEGARGDRGEGGSEVLVVTAGGLQFVVAVAS